MKCDDINDCSCYKYIIGIQGVPGEVGATGTSQIVGIALVTTSVINSVWLILQFYKFNR